MIEQPLSDKKRDYWATIFQTVMPDDNSGACDIKIINRSLSNNFIGLMYCRCNEESSESSISKVYR